MRHIRTMLGLVQELLWHSAGCESRALRCSSLAAREGPPRFSRLAPGLLARPRCVTVTLARALGLALAVVGGWVAAAPMEPARAEEDPFVLRLNPFKVGLQNWHRVGPEKVFLWEAEEGTLVIKGASGKEVPRLVYRTRAWDDFSVTLRTKKFATKLRLLLEPVEGDASVVVEVPRKAVSGDKWCELTLTVKDGKAVLLDAAGEESATADTVAGMRYRFGFEGGSGVSASVSDVRLVRRYVPGPQVCEEGFESLFDGENLAPWIPMKPEMAPNVSVADGLLKMEVRADDAAFFVLQGRTFKNYEMRFRALWGSTGLVLRAVEVPGLGGTISKTASAQLELTPHLDPDDVADFVVLVQGGRCKLTVNGKQMVDDPVGVYDQTPLLFIVVKGKKAMLRDIRIREITDGADAEKKAE